MEEKTEEKKINEKEEEKVEEKKEPEPKKKKKPKKKRNKNGIVWIPTHPASEKNRVKPEHLKHLDDFIQSCLLEYQKVDPKPEFYAATGDLKDYIISHKSTIPDLVIYNKTFNKNACFYGANMLNFNFFPRYLYYIRIKKQKKRNLLKCQSVPRTKKNKRNRNKKIGNMDEYQENLLGLNQNTLRKFPKSKKPKSRKPKKKKKNMHDNTFFSTTDFEGLSDLDNEEMDDDELNISNMNSTEYIKKMIHFYLTRQGWIIILNESNNQVGPGTSMDLYHFLDGKKNEGANLNDFTIIDISQQMQYQGDYFYPILSEIIQKIVQEKNNENDEFDSILDKLHLNNRNYNNYNNNQDDGLNKILNNISSSSNRTNRFKSNIDNILDRMDDNDNTIINNTTMNNNNTTISNSRFDWLGMNEDESINFNIDILNNK